MLLCITKDCSVVLEYNVFKYTLLCKNKKPINKMLPQWTMNLGPQLFESDALLSELLRHLLLGRPKIFIWSCSICSNWIIKVQDCSVVITKDNLRMPQVAHALIAQRREHWTWWLRPRFNTHLGNILLLDFLFSYNKVSDAIFAINTNSVCLWKTRIEPCFSCAIRNLPDQWSLQPWNVILW